MAETITTELVTSMVTAIVLIAIIIVSGGTRMLFRKRFNVTEHFESIDAATKRQNQAKIGLHKNVQTHKG